MQDQENRVMSGDIWQQFSQKIERLGAIVWGADSDPSPLAKAEGAQYLLRFLAAGLRICVELDDNDHPFIDYSIYNRMSWGLDNPDCNYSYARLDGCTAYRIFGNLGSAANIEFQVTSGHHADGNMGEWVSISAIRGQDMKVEENGAFELLLHLEPQHGNWLALSEAANFLLVREYFADWAEQGPASLYMEKLNAHYPPAPLSTHTVASRFDLLNQWLDVGAQCWQQFARGIMANEPADILPFLPPAGAAALGGQAYGMGSFELSENEAIVLEGQPPDCLVWGISLCDQFFQSIDYEARQSSLNEQQAQLQNGRFIGVIAHQDPGVANWLDPAGHSRGIIALRYVLTEEVPPLSYRRIPLSQLQQTLEALESCDLPGSISTGQRSESLRQRRLAYQQRYKAQPSGTK